jgi:hypothetical protein
MQKNPSDLGTDLQGVGTSFCKSTIVTTTVRGAVCTSCLDLMSAPSRRKPEGTVSRSICPAALRGGLRRPRWMI